VETRCKKTGRFLPGLVPWNAGTKGLGLTGANRGSFKKGQVPPNGKPLWSERIDRDDGYIVMKVPEEDPYTGFPTRYKHKHVWIYEQEHGPVPKGHVVIFRDQNKGNFDPKNLLAIKKADLVRLNQAGYKEAPDELKPSILALCRLKTKTGEARRKMMGTKICKKCKKEKDIKEFSKKKTNADGLDNHCKQCKSDYAKEYNAKKKGGKKRMESAIKSRNDSQCEVIHAVSSLALDIARMEGENAASMQEAAKYIIASVKKELLGAVFQELRGK
jgi:hypothetical protein